MATPLNKLGEFTETIALSGSTNASGAFSVTVTKARNITNVKSAYLVGTSLLYALRVTGWSGNTINLQLLAASGAAAGTSKGAPPAVAPLAAKSCRLIVLPDQPVTLRA